MSSPLLVLLIMIMVGSTVGYEQSLQERLSRVVRSNVNRAAPRKKSTACLDDHDADL